MIYERSYEVNGVPVTDRLIMEEDDEIASFLYLFFNCGKGKDGKKKPQYDDVVRVQVDWKDVDFAKWFRAGGGDND